MRRPTTLLLKRPHPQRFAIGPRSKSSKRVQSSTVPLAHVVEQVATNAASDASSACNSANFDRTDRRCEAAISRASEQGVSSRFLCAIAARDIAQSATRRLRSSPSALGCQLVRLTEGCSSRPELPTRDVRGHEQTREYFSPSTSPMEALGQTTAGQSPRLIAPQVR